MGFLQKIHNVILHYKVRSDQIRKTMNVELHLRLKKSQLRWLGNVSRLLQKRLARRDLLATLTGKRPRGRPRTAWCGYISYQVRSHLVVEKAELLEVAENH